MPKMTRPQHNNGDVTMPLKSATDVVEPSGGPPSSTFKWSVLTCRFVSSQLRHFSSIIYQKLIYIMPDCPPCLVHNATLMDVCDMGNCFISLTWRHSS